MHLPDRFTAGVLSSEGRHTVIAVFLDRSNILSTGSDRNFLVAAALAGTDVASSRTIDGEELGSRVDFLDGRLEGVNQRATDAAATASLVEGMGELRRFAFLKVLELIPGFATKQFLEPSAFCLANAHGADRIHVSLERVRAAIHLVCSCHLA